MKKSISIFLLFLAYLINAQTDYSDSWEDFFSYNNVKDFEKVGNVIYALVDNAVFTYNTDTEELNKLSSVQGLSGETTTSIHYSESNKRLVIGYENGLIEIVDEDGFITISSDIVNFNESGEKRINHIKEFENNLYISTPFGIVVYDIDNLEFGDTYFIGNNSTSLVVNQVEVFNEMIYAATENGIYTADVRSNLLIDFNNWQQQFSGRNFAEITSFNNQLYAVQGAVLYSIEGSNINQVNNFSQNINSIKASDTHLSVSLDRSAVVLDTTMSPVFQFNNTADFDFNLNTAFFEGSIAFLGTQQFGILEKEANSTNDYEEIHPEGPLFNDIFSIAVHKENLWVVYGGYDGIYTPRLTRKGYSHYNGESWINTRFSSSFPVTDLNYITIDTNAENKVYISSFGDTRDVNSVSTGGLLVVENDQVTTFYNHLNSPLEDIEALDPSRVTIRISGTAFDRNGNLWITNIGVPNELKKLSPNGTWTSIDMSSVKTNPSFGLSEMIIDNGNSVWYGSRNNGVFVYNENGSRKKSLIATPNLGNLPDATVRTVVSDANNRVWLGTRLGLSVYNNGLGVFSDDTPNANPIVINANEDGFGDRLLGDQTVNSIVIDGADNKWFGTDNGGVIYTNPSGQRTIASFSTQNSPLPSNRIVKIAVDNSTGKVYFATNKGIVVYDSNVAPFGESLGDVYAYPNPALKNHETVTVAGRNGTSLPKGTNVKILDVSGNLVYETNVVEGQELQGGKVVWNKKNLAGRKVASGVYIVLLSSDDASETSVTKIAIVN